jgi:GNAT superfamily N-acetyltransferase
MSPAKHYQLIPSTDTWIKILHPVELASYPSDEAASWENFYARHINAPDFFRVATLENGEAFGFVNGTLTAESILTEECMSMHDPNGVHLCIHTVVVKEELRRQGLATWMLKEYVKQILAAHKYLHSIRLICKDNLITFYKNCGFELIGQSSVVHGATPWFEMQMQLPSNG